VKAFSGKGEADQKGVIEPRPPYAPDVHPALSTTALDPIIIPIIPPLTLSEQELASQSTFFPTSDRPYTNKSPRNLTIDKINDGLP
jgi:hypothetical protein